MRGKRTSRQSIFQPSIMNESSVNAGTHDETFQTSAPRNRPPAGNRKNCTRFLDDLLRRLHCVDQARRLSARAGAAPCRRRNRARFDHQAIDAACVERSLLRATGDAMASSLVDNPAAADATLDQLTLSRASAGLRVLRRAQMTAGKPKIFLTKAQPIVARPSHASVADTASNWFQRSDVSAGVSRLSGPSSLSCGGIGWLSGVGDRS